MSEETRADNSTLEEQQAWVGEQFDLAIGASQQRSGWYFVYSKDVSWEEDRALLIGGLLPDDCGSSGAGRLDTSLKSNDVKDWAGAAARVREYWEAAGWVVTDVWSEPSPTEEYFRADRPDGAVLALQAAEAGISLEVSTACSLHSTVTNWEEYVDVPEETPTMQPDA